MSNSERRDNSLRAALVAILLGVVASRTDMTAQTFPERFVLDSTISHRINIADTTPPYEIFEKITNAPHILTREAVTRRTANDVLRRVDTVTRLTLDEYEAALRDLEIFSTISFDYRGEQLSPRIPVPTGTLITTTEDGWSLLAEPYEEPADDRTIWALVEKNVAGQAKQILIGGDLYSPGDSTWRGIARYIDPQLFGRTLRLESFLLWSRPRWDLTLGVERPLYTRMVPTVYGGTLFVRNGEDLFRFGSGVDNQIVDTTIATHVKAHGWFGSTNRKEDVFVASGSLLVDHHEHHEGIAHPRPFENTFGVFAGIRSIRRTYRHVRGFGFTGDHLVPLGAAGGVSIGKFFGLNGGDDDHIVLAVDARQTFMTGDLYTFLSVAVGTGLKQRQTELTTLRIEGAAGLPVGPGALVSAADLEIVWRWRRYLWSSATQGYLGLRGYDDVDVVGANHLRLNTEYRLFPLVPLFLWEGGVTLFHDIAGYWDQGVPFSDVRFHNAAGLGLRIGSSRTIDAGFLRIDFAWNFDRNEFGGISFDFTEAFDLFGTLDYRPPGPVVPQ